MNENQITRATIDSVAERLGLKDKAWGQDWDIELPEAADTAHYLAVYPQFIDAKEKFAAMRIIIAAYDELLSLGQGDAELEGEITKYIADDYALHRDTVEYWACRDMDDGFAVTPIMRDLLEQHEVRS